MRPSRPRYELNPGDRVVVTSWFLRGHKGTLIRRTWLPWNGRRAWVVELDGDKAPGGRTQKIGESVLIPVDALRD